MAQIAPSFTRLKEWEEIAAQLVEKYPERFGHVDPDKVVAYLIDNKDKTDTDRPYEMQTDKLPMRMSSLFWKNPVRC